MLSTSEKLGAAGSFSKVPMKTEIEPTDSDLFVKAIDKEIAGWATANLPPVFDPEDKAPPVDIEPNPAQ